MRRSIPPYVCWLGARQIRPQDHPVHGDGPPGGGGAIGANNQIIAQGETGFLASAPAEWLTHLRRLRDDQALRRRQGAAARQRVEQHFSLQMAAPILISHIKTIINA
jgi:hypothetical protein